MFDNDVDKVLAEGQKFVTKLDTAVKSTQVKAEGVQEKISKLEAERNELDRKVKKGSIVSGRIADLITVTDEEINAPVAE